MTGCVGICCYDMSNLLQPSGNIDELLSYFNDVRKDQKPKIDYAGS